MFLSSFFFPPSEDMNISPASSLAKMMVKRLSLAGTHRLYFTPPKGPILLQVYSISLHSTHPPSELKVEGVLKGWDWSGKQGWSLSSAVRKLKINKKGGHLRRNCRYGPWARHSQHTTAEVRLLPLFSLIYHEGKVNVNKVIFPLGMALWLYDIWKTTKVSLLHFWFKKNNLWA